METVLYEPGEGYYSRISGGEDYATSGRISPVFGFALSRLVSEFVSRTGDGLYSVVDIGCGDGSLLEAIMSHLPERVAARGVFRGIDRSASPRTPSFYFERDLRGIPGDLPLLVLSNELFDALPFARLVARGGTLQELYVRDEGGGVLGWEEHPAGPDYEEYFRSRGIELDEGQFADISLEWADQYRRLCELAPRSMVVTFDYGYPQEKLFDNRVRRYGTAAAYWRHQVSRDLLARPGEQDLTAHINFTDLIGEGETAGFQTLSFTRQAEFLLALGITAHPLFVPADEVIAGTMGEAVNAIDQREAARRLVLPDGIGQEIRVLVQAREMPADGWSFQQRLF